MKTHFSTQDTIFRLTLGPAISKAIYAAAKLGIADIVDKGRLNAKQLAKVTGTHYPTLYRLLRFLSTSGLGFFKEEEAEYFSLTPLGKTLKADSRESMRSWIIFVNEKPYEAWGHFLHSVETGESAFSTKYQKPLYEYCLDEPDFTLSFQRAMHDVHRAYNDKIIASYDFRGVSSIVDVGGGHGALLSGIIKSNPYVNGSLLDTEPAIRAAKRINKEDSPNFEYIEGDFFAGVPNGKDLYLLKLILHDWSDEKAIQILTNCRSAMAKGGKVLVIQALNDIDSRSPDIPIWDLHLLVMVGGRERTEHEYSELMEKAGLRLKKTIDTGTIFNIMEAVEAD